MKNGYLIEKGITKAEQFISSFLLGTTLVLSFLGVLTNNYEVLNSVDDIELSKNKREVEIVKEYYDFNFKLEVYYSK